MTNAVLTPNATISNKYVPGDKVWIIFSLGPVIKINQFEIKGMVMEVIDGKTTFMYGYNVDGSGRAGGLNLSFAKESMCYFDKEKAEKHAVNLVGDLVGEYRNEIQRVQEEANAKIANLSKAMGQINAKHLEVEEKETSPADEPVKAEPANQSEEVKSEVETETKPNPGQDGPEKEADPANSEAEPAVERAGSDL